MKISRFPVVVLASLMVVGCTSLVPTTVARLSQLSPLESDPADIAVALELPEGVSIREGSARLALAATRSDTGQMSDAAYVLARSDDQASGLTIFDISADDQVRLRKQQALIGDWKDDNEDATKGSLGVTFEGCALGDGPSEDAQVSVLIRTKEDGTFLPLLRNAPLTKVLDVIEIEQIEPC